LRNAIIWKFMMIKTFFYDTQNLLNIYE